MSTPHEQEKKVAGGLDLSAAPDIGAVEDEGVAVTIRGLDGEVMTHSDGQPVRIWMAGTYSNRYRRAEEAQATRRIRTRKRQVDGADVMRERRELVAACVLRWEGILENGVPVEPSKKAAITLFTVAPYVQEQCEDVMQDHEGFFGNSSGNS